MPGQWCSYCGSHAHTAKLCPKTWGGQGNRNALRCGYCGGRDHSNESCPKLGRAHRLPGTYVTDKPGA